MARGFAAAKADFEGFLEGSRQFFHLIYGRDNFVDEINFARVALIKQRGKCSFKIFAVLLEIIDLFFHKFLFFSVYDIFSTIILSFIIRLYN